MFVNFSVQIDKLVWPSGPPFDRSITFVRITCFGCVKSTSSRPCRFPLLWPDKQHFKFRRQYSEVDSIKEILLRLKSERIQLEIVRKQLVSQLERTLAKLELSLFDLLYPSLSLSVALTEHSRTLKLTPTLSSEISPYLHLKLSVRLGLKDTQIGISEPVEIGTEPQPEIQTSPPPRYAEPTFAWLTMHQRLQIERPSLTPFIVGKVNSQIYERLPCGTLNLPQYSHYTGSSGLRKSLPDCWDYWRERKLEDRLLPNTWREIDAD